MKTLLAIAALATLTGAAFALAPEREIVTEVTIDAEPSRVWTVLSDGAAYGSWNPFIVSMKGDVVEGGVLENTMQPEKDKRMTFRPKVLVAREAKELRWLGRLIMPGVFDGEHYFRLEPHEGGTKLVHGETFRGIGLWFIDAEPFRSNFEAMNVALKMRAEGSSAADQIR